MRKIAVNLVVLVIVLFATGSIAAAYTTDVTQSVTATATIGASTSMSVAPASIAFPTTSADAFADNPVTITYSSNYNPWKIAIYTNNTQVPNAAQANGRYQKGGLATASGLNITALKWVAKAPASAAPSIATIGGYNFVKDLRDEDDPTTAGSDESWAAAILPSASYAAIAFGNAAGGVCVEPTVPGYNGDPVNGTIKVYVAGLFATNGMTPAVPSSAGSYAASIGFDLYHD